MSLGLRSSLALAAIPAKTALVVDSSPEVNAVLNRVLASDGWTVERAVDNKTVLSLVKQRPFDLIITGQRTTGQEDVDLLGKIRGVRSHVRLIILANQSTPADVIAAVRGGAFSYCSGPFSRSELTAVVRSAMVAPAWDDGIEVVWATSNWVRVIARCDVVTADRLVQFLRAGSSVPEPEKDDVITAFHEILLNAMEHGGQFSPDHYVEIGYYRGSRMVICRVKDPGQGFSLEEIRHAAVNNPPFDLLRHMTAREEMGLRPGGFGVMLAKKLVDELHYNEKGNEVLLVKYLHQPS